MECLVECETMALADHHSNASVGLLDDKILEHRRKFKAVKEYADCLKPKHILRANYAIDILWTGPLIRSWCMTFEAMLQILKLIAHNSNYKDVNARIAKVSAIRQALSLYNSKLTAWNDMKLTYSQWTVAVTASCDNEIALVPNKHTTELDEFCMSVRAQLVTRTPRARCGVLSSAP